VRSVSVRLCDASYPLVCAMIPEVGIRLLVPGCRRSAAWPESLDTLPENSITNTDNRPPTTVVGAFQPPWWYLATEAAVPKASAPKRSVVNSYSIARYHKHIAKAGIVALAFGC
jgi:hypothetical protein